MKRQPLVSIVMPVYNGADFLAEAIDSALAQTYQNIEIIVVNDGSNDDGRTEEIALSYGDKIRYYAKENGGVATALNCAISHMRGDYFTWLSHDDLYEKNKVERELEEIEKCGDEMAIVFSDYYVNNMIDKISSTCRMESAYPQEQLENSFFSVFVGTVAGCTVLFHKNHFERVGVFDERLKTTQDYDLWFRLFRDQRIVFITEPLMTVRCHSQQGSRVLPGLEEREQMYMKFMAHITEKEKEKVFGSAYNYLVLMIQKYKSWELKRCLERGKREFLSLQGNMDRDKELEKVVESIYSAFPQKPEDLYIFGSGRFGTRILNMLKIRGVDVKGFIDNNADKEGLYIENIQCYILDEEIKRDSGIVVAIKENDEVLTQLKASGYQNVIMYQTIEKLLENTPVDNKRFLETLCGEENLLDDETAIKTSVIIPVYNMEKYVGECIESVLSQTQKDLEIILVNDGSTDGSGDILKSYEKKYDNIHVIFQENKKQGAARNAGLSIAKGNYIYFLDADDKLHPEAMKRCWEESVRNKLDIVFFDRKDIYDNDIPEEKRMPLTSNPIHDENIYTGKKFWNIHRGQVLTSSSFSYYRKNFLIDNQILFMENTYYEDGEHLFRCIMAAERVKAIPDCLYIRRYHAGSTMTSPMDRDRLSSSITVMEKIVADGNNMKMDRVTRQYIQKELLGLMPLTLNGWEEVEKLNLTEEYTERLNHIVEEAITVMKFENRRDALELIEFWSNMKMMVRTENGFLEKLAFRLRELFESLPSSQEAKEELSKLVDMFYDKFPHRPSKIYIFGSGRFGHRALDMLRLRGIVPDGFIDNDVNKEGRYIEDIRCYILDDEISQDAGIIVAIKKNEEICEQLKRNGYKNVILYEAVKELFQNAPIEERYFIERLGLIDEKLLSAGKIKTSVIIPVHNMEQYVRECIESVLAQTQQDLEIILVTDGSANHSEKILREYEKRYHKIHVISQENKRRGAAKNAGLSIAEGEFVYFLGADDRIETTAMERCWEECMRYKLDMIFFGGRDAYEEEAAQEKRPEEVSSPIFDEGIYTGKKLWDIYREKILMPSSSSYYRREFLETQKIWFLENEYYEDREYLFRCIMAAGRVKAIPDCLYIRRCHAGSAMTPSMDRDRLNSGITVMERIVADGRLLKMDRVTRQYIWKELALLLPSTLNGWEKVKKLNLTEEYTERLSHIIDSAIAVMKLNPGDNANDALEVLRFCMETGKEIKTESPFLTGWTQRYRNLFKEKVRILLSALPLNRKQRVGIYGVGRHTQEMLKVYGSLIGSINAEVIFIDKSASNEVSYFEGYRVIPPADIAKEDVGEIIISSYFYENEIAEELIREYGEKIKIWRFYDSCENNLFSQNLRNVYFD